MAASYRRCDHHRCDHGSTAVSRRCQRAGLRPVGWLHHIADRGIGPVVRGAIIKPGHRSKRRGARRYGAAAA
eukprot:1945899-Prymnesium_polylepis.1